MGAVTHALVTVGVRILEGIFAFGIVGSAIVVILAGYEDIVDMFSKEPSPSEGRKQ